MTKGLKNTIESIDTSWDGYSGSKVEEFIKGELEKLNNSKIAWGKDDGKGNFNFYTHKESDKVVFSIEKTPLYSLSVIIEKQYFLKSDKKDVVWYFKTHQNNAGSTLKREDVTVRYTLYKDGVVIDDNRVRKISCNPDTANENYTKVTENFDNKITGDGTYTLSINVVGDTTNITENITNIEINVINFLIYSDNTKFYEIKNKEFKIDVDVVCTLRQKFFFHYKIDNGNFVDSKEYTSNSDSRENKYLNIDISNLSDGLHTIDYCIGINLGESRIFYTDYVRVEFIKKANENSDIPSTILVYAKYKENDKILTENGETIIYGIEQYVESSINFGYYHNNKNSIELYYDIDGILNESISVQNEGLYTIKFNPSLNGEKYLTFYSQNDEKFERKVLLNIKKYNTNLTPYEDNLAFDVSSIGKSKNSMYNKEWKSSVGGYKATFSGSTIDGFDWSKGWTDNGLVVPKDSILTFDYCPFPDKVYSEGSHIITEGKGYTFEIEFMTQNVTDENIALCEMVKSNNNECSLIITGSEFKFISPNGGVVSTRFKVNDLNRISLVINPRVGKENGKDVFKGLVELYINGILSNISKFNYTDVFSITKNLKSAELTFKGSEYGEIVIKNIKTYNEPLTHDNILDNYILSRPNKNTIDKLVSRNDILLNNGKISYEKLISDACELDVPVLFLIGRTDEFIPSADGNNNENEPYKEGSKVFSDRDYTTLEKTTNKKEAVNMDVVYYNPNDLSKNFKFINAYITPQGTSSMYYPKKNFRIYTQKNDDTRMLISNGDYIMNDLSAMVSSGFGETSDSRIYEVHRGISNKKKRKYKFKDNAQAVKCWCLKADFAESSSSHNTGIARLWNDALKNSSISKINDEGKTKDLGRILRTKAQEVIEEKYKDKKSEMPDVRTTIDGFPIVVFASKNYNLSENLVFLGQYNFNNDKSTESVFGFCDIDDDKKLYYKDENDNDIECTINEQLDKYMICVETLDNGNILANFADSAYTTSDSSNNEVVLSWDDAWDKAFEFRYPEIPEEPDEKDYKDNDGKWLKEKEEEYNKDLEKYNKDIAEWNYLKLNPFKHFAMWVNSTKWCDVNGNGLLEYSADERKDRRDRFAKEKWDHLDVWKVAAYYVYLMRFGAVDQVVKNSMLTTEGPFAHDIEGKQYGKWDSNEITSENYGKNFKWYYINYDNDTIMGVKNDGRLKYDPNITRQSTEGTEGNATSIYAGEKSVLWNNLENDSEFQNIVAWVDQSLYGNLSYQKVIDMFENKQSGQWSERIYNKDAMYKYIDSYIGGWEYDYENADEEDAAEAGKHKISDVLYMLQGARTAHRRWWLSKRFNLFDGKWNSGSFAEKYIQVKCNFNKQGDIFTAKSGADAFFGYKINGITFGTTPIEGANFEYKASSNIEWKLGKDIQVGDPIAIYGANDLLELNLSNISKNLCVIDFYVEKNSDDSNKLTKLVLSIPEDSLKEHYYYKEFADDDSKTISDYKRAYEKLQEYCKTNSHFSEIWLKDENSWSDSYSTLTYVITEVNADSPDLYRIYYEEKGNYVYFLKIKGTLRNNVLDRLTLNNLDKLKTLGIAGFIGFSDLNLEENKNIEEIDARYTNLTSINLPKEGSNLSSLKIPETFTKLELSNCDRLKLENICINDEKIEDVETLWLQQIYIKNCKYLTENIKLLNFLKEWFTGNDAVKEKELVLEGVVWNNVSIKDLEDILKFKRNNTYCKVLKINGLITISKSENILLETNEIINQFINEVDGSFTIEVPNSVIIKGPNEITAKEGEVTFECDILPNIDIMDDYNIEYTFVKEISQEDYELIDGGLYDRYHSKYYRIINDDEIRNGTLIFLDENKPNKENNYSTKLTITESIYGEDISTKIAVIIRHKSRSEVKFSIIDLIVKDPTYIEKAEINGDIIINETGKTFNYELILISNKNDTPTGTFNVEWNISDIEDDDYGDGATNYISSSSVTADNKLIITTNSNTPVDNDKPSISKFKITAVITNKLNELYPQQTSYKVVNILNKDIIMTKDTNDVVMTILYNNGMSSNVNYMTLEDAEKVETFIINGASIFANKSEEFTFNEFKYFNNEKLNKISEDCFKNSNIKEITIPYQIKSIGNSAFENCKKLEKINFNSVETKDENGKISNISCLETIGESSFKFCSNLRQIKLPDSVTTIENYAFGGTNIKGILFYNDIITDYYLYITSNSNLTIIKNYAFDETQWLNDISQKTNKLEVLSLPRNIELGNTTCKFLLSDNLKSIIYLDDKYENIFIENDIIYNEDKTEVIRCFSNSNEIDVLDLSSIELVYDFAFYNNENIKKVIFGANLGAEGLGKGAFYNSSIKSIDLANTTIKLLPIYAFYNTKNLQEINLPSESLTTLGYNLFVNCESLTGITIPNSVNSINTIDNSGTTNTFVNCGIETLIFESNPKAEKVNVTNFISNCANLKTLKLPCFINTNNKKVVLNCNNIEDVTLPLFAYNNEKFNDTLNFEFLQSNNIKRYSLNENDERTYYTDNENGVIYEIIKQGENEHLKVIKVPTLIDSYENVIIKNVKEIGNYAFYGCNIENIDVSDDINSIGQYCFSNCKNLTNVTIGKNIKLLDTGVFNNCRNLESVKLYGAISRINSFVFGSCVNLHEIFLYSNNIETGVPALSWTKIKTIGKTNEEGVTEQIIIYDNGSFGHYSDDIAGKNSEKEKYIYIPNGTYDLFNVKYYVIFDSDKNDLLSYETENVFTIREKAEEKLSSLNNEKYQIKEIDNPWVSPLVSYSNFAFKDISLDNEVTLKLINENGESYNNGTITLVSDNDKLRFTATNEPRTSTFNNDINGYNIDFNNNVNHGEEVSIFNDNGDYIGSFVADYKINTYEARVENLEHNASTYSLRNNSNTEEMANITKKEYEALISRVNQMAEIIGKLKK